MKNIHEAYGRDLDLNLLRVFAVVAEEGSITRAASRLYVTQPAVSAAVRRLTSFVGTELIARQGRGVVLTTRGTELVAAARAHLLPLVAATMEAPLFDAKESTAMVRVGLADGLEMLLLAELHRALRAEAPRMQLVVVPAQFRTVEALLLSNKVDFAVTVADELPRSILRQTLPRREEAKGFAVLYDSRFLNVGKTISEREYFAHEHVVVSYAGDARGIIEDALGKSRNVRVSVPSFAYVADVIDGSSLVATVPSFVAQHVQATRPHLRSVALPFALDGVSLELLWSRVTDDDAAPRFVRSVVARIVGGRSDVRTAASRAARSHAVARSRAVEKKGALR